jgi:hypothetical protein
MLKPGLLAISQPACHPTNLNQLLLLLLLGIG